MLSRVHCSVAMFEEGELGTPLPAAQQICAPPPLAVQDLPLPRAKCVEFCKIHIYLSVEMRARLTCAELPSLLCEITIDPAFLPASQVTE